MSAARALRAGLILLLATPLAAQVPFKTRQEIVAYGATAIGSPYVWGGGSWDPEDRDYGGADCSGFVSKCWSLTRWTPYRVEYHGPYSTSRLVQTPGPYWYEVDRSELIYGDAIVYRYEDDSGGHTYLYLSSDGWGEHEVYEARGSAYGIVHRWRTALGSASVVKGIRRTGLIENVGVTEHIVETDDGAPAYSDVGMTGSSQYDSYAPGCTEGDCPYRWVTADRSKSCTYRPNLPEAGRYRVYVTCNEGSPNVRDAGVTIYHTLGSQRVLWDQADPASLNRWVPVTDQSYLFAAGSSGTVVWDDLQAWPTTGEYAFRGDATKFVLDNRVEVDGLGAAPGTFATLREALAWIATHESEEPDVIDITCDSLLESGCIEIDLWDDVTINGDADGNGVPVTIAVAPSVPADWSRPCGLYLDVPIQRRYALRDIVLIPQYVAPGYSTAYGLVIDEQNPAADACAIAVALENVTVAGSLPGNIATDAGQCMRDQATMFGSADANTGAAVLQRDADWAGDDGCRQHISASNLTITHSATRGLALRSAYTDWDIDGGLIISCCGLEGIRADHIGSSTLTLRDTSGSSPNLITRNLGGGVVHIGSAGTESVRLEHCILRDNRGSLGGAITAIDASLVVRNCLLAANESTSGGGAIYGVDGHVGVAACTIVDNTAAQGGAVYAGGGGFVISSSILWGNGSRPIAGSPQVAYCDVEGGFAGMGDFAREPAFLDAAAGDYRLRRCSPCVNEGDPGFVASPGETDLEGTPRLQCGFVDVGAFETPYWDGDVDHDNNVDHDDLVVLLACLAGPDCAPAVAPPLSLEACVDAFDIDEDGDIDLRDMADFRLR